ncbi:MAG: peptidoglycan-binding protein LysM [Flavobacteriaceae bacterium]
MFSGIFKNNFLIIFFLISTSFNNFDDDNPNLIFEDLVTADYVDKANYFEEAVPDFLFLKKDFIGFKEILGYKESTSDYKKVNKFGFMGKYQFNLNTLKMYKIKNSKKFINNAELQERVFLINVQRNKWILRKDIKWFVGSNINNTIITESGIIAAAHLAGPGNVKKYLRSGGKYNTKDAFGTSISKYMEYFKGYDLSMIEAVRKPKVMLL